MSNNWGAPLSKDREAAVDRLLEGVRMRLLTADTISLTVNAETAAGIEDGIEKRHLTGGWEIILAATKRGEVGMGDVANGPV